MMKASGRFRNRIPKIAEIESPNPARRVLERIEGAKTLGDDEINSHDHDRDHRKGSGKRQVSGRALLRIHDLADERTRAADHARNDEIAKRERKGEDRAGRHARDRQGKDDLAEGLSWLCAEIRRSLDERTRY